MKNDYASVLIAGVAILVASFALLFGSLFLFPGMMEEYYNAVFRSSSFETDWLFYLHPFVLSAALKWFWEHSKDSRTGSSFSQAFGVALAYCLVSLLPVLLLSFSAINISLMMVVTWIAYGFMQSFIGGFVFASRASK